MRVPPALLVALLLAASPAFAGTMRVDWSASITEIEDCSADDYCGGEDMLSVLAGLGAVGETVTGSFRYDVASPAGSGPNGGSAYPLLGFEARASWHFVAYSGQVEVRNDGSTAGEDRIEVFGDDLLARQAEGGPGELVFFDTVRLSLSDPGAAALRDQGLPRSLDDDRFPLARLELWRSSCWLNDEAVCESSNTSARLRAEVRSLNGTVPEPGTGVLMLLALSTLVLAAGRRR